MTAKNTTWNDDINIYGLHFNLNFGGCIIVSGFINEVCKFKQSPMIKPKYYFKAAKLWNKFS